MAGTTKRKLIPTFTESILAKSRECKQSDFAAMDGGAFFIGAVNRNILIDLLVEKQAAEDYKMGLVPTIADKTIFFADIDNVPANFDFSLFLSLVVDQFNELATNKIKPATLADILIFKREDAAKYHIYIPCSFGEVSKAVRQAIYKGINRNYIGNIIDEAAHTIRIEGFEKYDKTTKQYIAGSRYLPKGLAKKLKGDDLLNAVWLNPRGWDEEDETVLAGLFDNDEQKAESMNDTNVPSPEGSVDIKNKIVTEEMENRIKTNYAEIAHIILKYPVISIRRLSGASTFMLDKSEAGRTCAIAGRVHTSNNTYLCYYKDKRALYQKCFSSSCTDKPAVLIYKIDATKTAVIKRSDLPTPDDASIAEYFIKWNPLIAVERDGKENIWYVYDEVLGYWKTSPQEMIMQMIVIPFREWIKAKFDRAIQEGKDDQDDLIKTAGEVDNMLRTVRTVKGIAECIRWQLASDVKIEWNANPNYTVFPNGVLQVDKRDEANPDLYYFGKTKPEEYISNAKCMKLPFNCPPVCNDGHYIEQAEALLRDWIKLVQPEADDRCLLLMFLALSLKAIDYEKMILNIGHSGDNAKSSYFEMAVYLLGSYGLTGDKCLIIKVKKDRVSKASLDRVRFVLFEEPDASKALDVEAIKDLVGGAVESTGRFNFSNDNTIKLHCKTVLNANTMTSVQLESAIMNRLLYLAWTSQFVSDDNLVDLEQRIYKADNKFKTVAYWESVNDGFIWLLLNHYRLFELNENKLRITNRQVKRTKAELLDNDLFINWFKENFIYLADTPSNRQKFVTQAEIVAQFKLLSPSQQQQIIGSRNYAPDKFIRDMIQIHSALKACYKKKVTNWRLGLVERIAAKNTHGPNGQYQRNVLIRFTSRAEFESGPQLEAGTLRDTEEYEAKSNVHEDDEDLYYAPDDDKLDDNYLYSKDLFFRYMDPADGVRVADIEQQARALYMDIDDGVLIAANSINYDEEEDAVLVYGDEVNDFMNENDNNNLMNENSDNRGGNGNLMNSDNEANDDPANEEEVKDQADEVQLRRSKRKRVKLTYKNSQYNGRSANDGAKESAKKRRKKN